MNTGYTVLDEELAVVLADDNSHASKMEAIKLIRARTNLDFRAANDLIQFAITSTVPRLRGEVFLLKKKLLHLEEQNKINELKAKLYDALESVNAITWYNSLDRCVFCEKDISDEHMDSCYSYSISNMEEELYKLEFNIKKD